MSNKMAPDLGKLDELAKVHALSYASPHHFTMSVNGLREVIAELQLPAGNKMALDALTEPKAVSLTDVLQAAAPAEIADALAPVVQAVQAVELIEQEMAMLIRRLCSTTANDKTRAQAMEYLFKRGHASPLRAESEPAQAREPGKYDDVLKPFFTLMERELHANSGKGDRPGWLAMKPDQALLEVYHHVAKLAKAVRDNDGPGIMEYGADVANMAMMVLDLCGSLAWVDAYRASSGAAQAAPRCVTCDGTGEVHRADGTWVGTCFCAEGKRAATTQAVRMLTQEELEHCRLWYDGALNQQLGVLRKFCEVNAGRTIPADGKMGGV